MTAAGIINKWLRDEFNPKVKKNNFRGGILPFPKKTSCYFYTRTMFKFLKISNSSILNRFLANFQHFQIFMKAPEKATVERIGLVYFLFPGFILVGGLVTGIG